jgi:hypothetical protein
MFTILFAGKTFPKILRGPLTDAQYIEGVWAQLKNSDHQQNTNSSYAKLLGGPI